MIEDPLGLVLQAVFVLAAGMYPVGFLFGACATCCGDCPPCSRCTHYANGCPNYDYLTSNSWIWDVDWSYTVDGIGTFTFPNVPFEPDQDANGDFDIPESDLPAIPQAVIDRFNAYQENTALDFGACYFRGSSWGDEDCGDTTTQDCPCGTCDYSINLRAVFRFVASPPNAPNQSQDFEANFTKCFRGSLANCSETAVALTSPGEWSFLAVEDAEFTTGVDEDGNVYAVYAEDNSEELISVSELITDILDWLNDHPVTEMTLSGIEACECGACCEGCPQAYCSNNVAERSCTQEHIQFSTPGTWLGAGTTCQNDGPCPTGSCCETATGTCRQTYMWECGYSIGDEPGVTHVWTLGQSCDPNPCPQPPLGACCDGNGNCTQMTEASCGGTWTEGVECDPNPCPQLGSCCDPATGDCTQTLEASCDGTWTEGESCDPNPCPQPPLGACCSGGGCSQTTQADCGGFWYEAVECSPNPCVLGWCCIYRDGEFNRSRLIPERECDNQELNPRLDSFWTEGTEEVECPETPPE